MAISLTIDGAQVALKKILDKNFQPGPRRFQRLMNNKHQETSADSGKMPTFAG